MNLANYLHHDLVKEVDQFVGDTKYDKIDLSDGISGKHFRPEDEDGPGYMMATKSEKALAAFLALRLVQNNGLAFCLPRGTGFYREALSDYTGLGYLECKIIDGDKVRNCVVGRLTTSMILGVYQNCDISSDSLLGVIFLLGEKYTSDNITNFFYKESA